MKLTINELDVRRAALCAALNNFDPAWDTVLIADKVNQYYFTGTMQDAVLFIRRDGALAYFVRRSVERARAESPIKDIYPMNSYRDAAGIIGNELGKTYIESEIMPCAMLSRLQNHFNMNGTASCDNIIKTVRCVKSPYELYLTEMSGKIHDKFLSEEFPTLLQEGMSEAELYGEVYRRMIYSGYQGISRFFQFQTEFVVGQIAFGENSLYPTSFDGPGGSRGMCAAVPVLGSPDRRLKKGDLVFADIGFGVCGYHSDKTRVYMFGAEPDSEFLKAHEECVDIQKRTAALLKPGAVPSAIYDEITQGMGDGAKKNFMGFGDRTVKFLGHGVGLYIDEFPVIAKGFNEPLKENMVIALEPKKGVSGIGMAGVEDTYIVTPEGGRCITGDAREIVVVL